MQPNYHPHGRSEIFTLSLNCNEAAVHVHGSSIDMWTVINTNAHFIASEWVTG